MKDKEIEGFKAKIKSISGEYREDISNCKKLIESQLNDFIKFKETMTEQTISNVSNIANIECVKMLQHQQTKERTKAVNDNERIIDKLKHEIKMLQTDIDQTKHRVQIERKSYIDKIRNLEKQNNDLEFELNFDRKSKENQTNLNKMNYEQTQDKYSMDSEIHIKNMRSIYSFLTQTNKAFQAFVNKYSAKKNNINNNENNEENREETNKNDVWIRDIEPKLSETYANFQKFLSDISMIILSKETDHLNVDNDNDMDVALSDCEFIS